MAKLCIKPFTQALIFLLGCTGCAGPLTPIGAVGIWKPGQVGGEGELVFEEAQRRKAARKDAASDSEPRISITPSRQILHGRASVRVTIKDSLGDFSNYQLFVRYNGNDVSDSFMRQSRISTDIDGRKLVIENPVVKLPATADHLIELVYLNSLGSLAYSRYDAPTCSAFRARPIHHVGEFSPPKRLVRMIQKVSQDEGFNPAFFTALVAQESSFNPRQVSWAKAIGLTQVTTIAEKEIAPLFADWPRFPGMERLSASQVKFLVLNGEINASNEWRLDSGKSIKGGAAFLRLLAERWSTPANMKRIRGIFRDPEVSHTRLILASYHSGYARVSSAVDQYGTDWLKAPSLREARKYVNRIFSYCNYFAEGDSKDAEEA